MVMRYRQTVDPEFSEMFQDLLSGALIIKRQNRLGCTHPTGRSDQRVAGFQAMEEAGIGRDGIGCSDLFDDLDTAGPQTLDACTIGARVRIPTADHNPDNACLQQSFAARRGHPVMIARFKRDIGGRSVRGLAGPGQGDTFGMRAPAGLGRATCEDLARFHQNTSDRRVGSRMAKLRPGPGQCQVHVEEIGLVCRVRQAAARFTAGRGWARSASR